MDKAGRDFFIKEWVLWVICLLIVLARLAVRTWHRVWSFWLSEIFLLISLLFFLILVVGDTYTISIGLDAFKEGYYDEGFAKWKFASSVTFDLGFYFPRFSLLAFYNELFPQSEKTLRLCLRLVTIYTICAFSTTFFVDIFWCGSDVYQNWVEADATCSLANSPQPMYINWTLGIASELLVFALPFGILRLKALQTKDRRALLCIFLLGIATLCTSIARFVLTVQSIWSLSTYLVGSVEIATQIIVISLPALRPLLGGVSRSWTKYSQSKIESRNEQPFHNIKENQQGSATVGSVRGNKGAEFTRDVTSVTP